MQKTINYNLNKPNYSDQYDLRHWNDNMDIIDSQMKAEENARIQNDALKENLSNKVSSFQSTPDNTHYPSEKLVKDYIDGEVDDLKEDLSEGNMTVYAASHDDDDNFIRDFYEWKSRKKSSWSNTPNDTNYPSEKLVKDSLDSKENSSNKVTSFQSTPDDTHYPSEKLVFDNLAIKKVSNAFYSVASNSGTTTLSSFDKGELRFVSFRSAFTDSQAHPKVWLKLPTTGNYYIFPLGQTTDGYINPMRDNLQVYYTNNSTDSDVALDSVTTVAGGNYVTYLLGGIVATFLIYRVS